ncbi:sulfate permease [Agromyces larvae]|uniref:Sulfate permease n=1 Tax=Agromyces larvae TaxID=2929802 RepID=A0ABY4C0K2_9MICO|nr:sulfate permease [Agromyces larvae]UOE44955.1 sulfate permease [Agromyces larvae]
MFGFVWAIIARGRAVLRFMPTNLVLDALHTRRGLKWGVPAMLLAVVYGLAAAACAGVAERGGPGWANLLVLLFVWNALKFIVAGPITLMRLIRVRASEARERRRAAASHGRRESSETDASELRPAREDAELVR